VQVVQLLEEIENLTTLTIQGIRDAVWLSIVSSHVLGSLEVSTELAEVIFGYGLTGRLIFMCSTELMTIMQVIWYSVVHSLCLVLL
jgi:hypothetical protein